MKNALLFMAFILLAFSCKNQPGSGNTPPQQNELLNDGFQTKNSRNSTNSSSSIETDNELLTLDNYLRRVAGVSVSGSGPGTKVRIRGIKSFSGDQEPLFVIDGLPISGGFSSVNSMVPVRDIERISVLKGGSSTTLYGIRGAAGVIVITTRK